MKPPISAKLKSMFSSIAILIVAGIIFPLLLIEVITHLVPGLVPAEVRTSIFQTDPPYQVLKPDEELGYKYAPNVENHPIFFEDKQYTVSTVSLGYDDIGFRDDGISKEPFAVVVGDSFANCAGVEMEHCWVELLEEETNQDFANLSVLGYSPQQEARMLTKYGLQLKPELILWIFYTNDLKDAWRFNRFGSGAARDNEFWQSPIRAWLAENSTIYTTLLFFWYNRFFFYHLITANDDTQSHNPNLSWWLANTDLSVPEVADGFALIQTIILDVNKQILAQDNEVKFLVIILPHREQIYTDIELQTRFDYLNNSLVDFLRQNEILVIDLTPDLRERAKIEAEPFYFEEDIHLNVRGNEIVAELLKQKIDVIFDQDDRGRSP